MPGTSHAKAGNLTSILQLKLTKTGIYLTFNFHRENVYMDAVESLDMIIAGVGGQGNIISSQIIAQSAINEGWHASVGETYGASQRGGSVMSHVRLYKSEAKGPLVPRGMCGLVIGFEPLEALRVLLDYGNAGTRVVYNITPIYPIGVSAGAMKYPRVEEIYQRIEQLGAQAVQVDATPIVLEWEEPRVLNMVMVGALSQTGFIPVSKDALLGEIEETFSGSALGLNKNAFEAGERAIRKG